ncbi:MAG TPA: adenosylcobinamide-GDP ribazoletransferase [Stellaceae bacterium]|nr:adenosylcobinamide-GDP ribazoletransferase [Stellaceae bacterium]
MAKPSWEDLPARREEALNALAYFTRLRFAGRAALHPGDLAKSAWAFPLIGLAIGVAGTIIYDLAALVGIPPLVSGLLAIGATAIISGGLHEDGLAHSVEGLSGGHSVEERLETMRAGHIGVYGIVAIILSVGLRGAALAMLGSALGMLGVVAGLVAAHALARGLLAPALLWGKPAAHDTLDAGTPRPINAGIAVAIGLLIAILAMGFMPALLALILAGAAMALVLYAARARAGGYTGEVLGAMEQAGEIVILLVAAVWA